MKTRLTTLLFKVYLVNQDDEEAYSFIRKRTTIDKNQNRRGEVYQITTVQRTSEGETIEQKRYVLCCIVSEFLGTSWQILFPLRIITAREYNTAYKSRDVSRHVIIQKRISFLYKLQSFTVHVSFRG